MLENIPWDKVEQALFRQLSPREIIIWSAIFVFYFVALALISPSTRRSKRIGIAVSFFLYYALVYYITVFRREDRALTPSMDLFTFFRNDTVYRAMLFDYCLNILLFVPLGFLFARWIYAKAWVLIPVGVMASFVLSLCIEATQLLARRGVFAIDDLVSNTLGGAVGCVLGCIVNACARALRKYRKNRRIRN